MWISQTLGVVSGGRKTILPPTKELSDIIKGSWGRARQFSSFSQIKTSASTISQVHMSSVHSRTAFILKDCSGKLANTFLETTSVIKYVQLSKHLSFCFRRVVIKSDPQRKPNKMSCPKTSFILISFVL